MRHRTGLVQPLMPRTIRNQSDVIDLCQSSDSDDEDAPVAEVVVDTGRDGSFTESSGGRGGSEDVGATEVVTGQRGGAPSSRTRVGGAARAAGGGGEQEEEEEVDSRPATSRKRPREDRCMQRRPPPQEPPPTERVERRARTVWTAPPDSDEDGSGGGGHNPASNLPANASILQELLDAAWVENARLKQEKNDAFRRLEAEHEARERAQAEAARWRAAAQQAEAEAARWRAAAEQAEARLSIRMEATKRKMVQMFPPNTAGASKQPPAAAATEDEDEEPRGGPGGALRCSQIEEPMHPGGGGGEARSSQGAAPQGAPQKQGGGDELQAAARKEHEAQLRQLLLREAQQAAALKQEARRRRLQREKEEQVRQNQATALQSHRESIRKEAAEKEELEALKARVRGVVKKAAMVHQPFNLYGFMHQLKFTDFTGEPFAEGAELKAQLRSAMRMTHPDKQRAKTKHEKALAEEAFKVLHSWE